MQHKIKKEVSLWMIAGRTVPFIALALLVGFDYLNLTKLQDTITILIIVGFIAVSVFWWWWVLYRILDIIKAIKKSQENFETIKKNIEETKKTINEKDSSNR